MQGQWFRFAQASTSSSIADIHVIDFIGDWIDDATNRFWGANIGVTARAFVEQLSKLPAGVKTIRLHINSPGGDVQAGINIANALRAEQVKGRVVETYVDGLAASIASVIAMAGSKVVMADNALMMIHDPWTIALGNAAEFTKALDMLAANKAQIIATYRWHSHLGEAEISKLMSAETWMTAAEAHKLGFVTATTTGRRAAASLPRSALNWLPVVPDALKTRFEALVAPPPPGASNSAPSRAQQFHQKFNEGR